MSRDKRKYRKYTPAFFYAMELFVAILVYTIITTLKIVVLTNIVLFSLAIFIIFSSTPRFIAVLRRNKIYKPFRRTI
jgi:hypothetical protein